MKIKTSKLEGAALDWAVSKCEAHPNISGLHPDGGVRIISGQRFNPSRLWADGGPIIERKCISIARLDPKTEEDTNFWVAHIDGIYCRYGLTALIAAMRCYVASKLGDEVDVPDTFINLSLNERN